jgi:hypothetical protein
MSTVAQRRVPRRIFEAPVGVLASGNYFVSRSLQVGEGGMHLISEFVLEMNQLVVLSFQVPSGSLISVRAIVRYVKKDVAGLHIGLQFENLDFQYKRELRNFVAAATQASIFA